MSAMPIVTSMLSAAQRAGERGVSAGANHAFIIETDGTLRAWTSAANNFGNENGELGLGHHTGVPPYKLFPVPGLADVMQVEAGRGFAFARQRSGRILAWGANTMGVLGTTVPEEFARNLARTEDADTPTPLGIALDARGLSASSSFALAAARDGTAYAWGQGTYGRLGIGALPVIKGRVIEDVPYPIRIPGLSGVTAVAAGVQHGLALIEDGTVRAWGYNVDGEVGDGTAVQRPSPVPVSGIRNAVAVAAGSSFSLALLADGTLMTWGHNGNGQLGRQTSGAASPIPSRAAGVNGIRAIVAGVMHVLALTDSGTVMAWGENGHSATGTGTGGPVAKVVPRLARVQSIATRFNRSFAVLSDGQIVAWGDQLKPWARPTGAKDISPFPRPLELEGI